ncbi:MAG: lipopolysaccharide heptosyltransferase II [Desulfobacter postgatei]|uniref:lipopolysaccharide heptosyltransferase II n=1 Tax=Desulfobacter postgatei TaxID=2293 RepID=A0A2G6MTI0_9BACT|nr:MAG: lipopolysaccharide heptosyltransferase II [Desulfobacter postgatei]
MADAQRGVFDRVNRILIVKPSALGDIVHSMPFLHVLKKRFPWARIDWVVAHGLHTFLEGHPMINRLWVIKKDQWKKLSQLRLTLKEINALRQGLAEQHYDVCIDLSGLFRSGVISAFSKAPVRLGFDSSDEGSPLFYTHKIHGSMKIHAIDRYLEIARFMGCAVDKVEYPFAPHNPAPDVMKELPEDYVIICPSAGKPANRWPASKYGALASMLDLPVVVIASAPEADIAQEVVESSQGNAVSLAGKTNLKDLLPVIGNAKYFICNDTGPMHIAAALGIPVFAIFGPANPVRTGPYGTIHTVIQKKLDCSPCYAHTPCRRYRCMEELTVTQVFDQIQYGLKIKESTV